MAAQALMQRRTSMSAPVTDAYEDGSNGPLQQKAADVFKAPSVWVPPLVLVALLIFVMTLVYLGSVINPAGHLHGLPVAVVNEDVGAPVGSRHIDLGQEVASGLTDSRAVARRLSLRAGTLAETERRMDVGKEYATIVIPVGFTASLLAIGDGASRTGKPAARPTIELLTNPRAGTLGVSLATGVLDPAIAQASREIGKRLDPTSSRDANAAASILLADPVTVETVAYRPLPSHTALGLSAFYIALLITFCGFLGGIIVNVSADTVLGYAVTEIGPRWGQRQPVPISRWQTLLAKWAMAVPLMVVLTGLMLLAAVGVLDMNTPHFWDLWLLAWFAATVVALGTLVLFAALGTLGQLVAIMVFVYLALASSGGTVPIQALSGFFRFLASFEPMRQIVGGTRAVLYFNASGEAGLTRAFVLTALGLAFWLALGALVTTWYDRKGFYRMPPGLMDYVDRAVHGYKEQTAQGTPTSADPSATSGHVKI
jgi:YhgE/Pip-like protein